MRQEPRQAVRLIRDRVRINAFTYTRYSFERMVDQGIDEEDVKRAIASSRLVETRDEARRGTYYVLQGFAMDEEDLVLVCRLLRQKVEVADLYRP